jgi:hypothetical protein
MKSWIYAIESLGSGLVKLGLTINVEKRMKDLQTGSPSPLHFIGAFPGDHRTEKHIHKKYNKYWESGEWYNLPFGLAEQIIEEGWESHSSRELQMELDFERQAAVIEMPVDSNHVILVQAGRKAA